MCANFAERSVKVLLLEDEMLECQGRMTDLTAEIGELSQANQKVCYYCYFLDNCIVCLAQDHHNLVSISSFSWTLCSSSFSQKLFESRGTSGVFFASPDTAFEMLVKKKGMLHRCRCWFTISAVSSSPLHSQTSSCHRSVPQPNCKKSAARLRKFAKRFSQYESNSWESESNGMCNKLVESPSTNWNAINTCMECKT